jgi:hypothetical protein
MHARAPVYNLKKPAWLSGRPGAPGLSEDREPRMPDTEMLGSGTAASGANGLPDATEDEYGRPLEPSVIKRNMLSLVLLETTFWTGSADINLALQPLLVYMGASNTMIGAVNGAVWIGLIGVLNAASITRWTSQ